ncbi:lysylphosphatidylglycerol synthase transmembrane domain-containing protein [Jiangella anatolica]|uniref:lysylphosphatidylglycerol synthase transmembrane domain-containing protein n=1 Tax=Jiangella anatolica TaxID=2670374 RepID=UPI00131498C3|nr:lysylphosphatidylglycerol synthase domain-containing protein [Jiangella anatolica]
MATEDTTTTRTRRSAISGSTRRVVGLLVVIAILVVVCVVIVPSMLPNLISATRSNPYVPLLVALFWIMATTAAIAGKRAIASGYLTWSGAATAHIGGTVANRVVPAGVGAAGVFVAALHRGGASNTAAAGVVALWAVAGGLAHASGLLLGVAWLREGWSGLLTVVAVATVVVFAVRFLVRRLAARRAARTPSTVPVVVPAGQPTKLQRVRATAREVVAAVRARPILAVAALGAQLTAALCLATGFALAAEGFGVEISIVVGMAAYLAGTALSAATPTPAGIGSAETALVGALMLAGAGLGEALPVVFLFRAVVLIAPVVAAALMAVAWVGVRLVTAARARRRTARTPHVPHALLPSVVLIVDPEPAPELP